MTQDKVKETIKYISISLGILLSKGTDMKRTIFLSALLASSLAFATDYNYEVTPVVGYNFAQSKTALDNNELYGAEVQYNGFASAIKPELSFLYSPDVDFDAARLSTQSGISYTAAKSDLFRTAINGVYQYDKFGSVIPLAKAGIGYEQIADDFGGNNENGVFADLGAGAKVPFSKQIALKLEALYMLKDNKNSWDSNLALLAGLNIAFGSKAAPMVETPKAAPAPAPAPEPVDGDDDNDGVKNSVDACPNTSAGVAVDASGCKIDGDDDNDGVKNSMDKCPDSPAGAEVTPEGCPIIINLHINFEYNSAKIDMNSAYRIEKFANFLKMYKHYNANIVGYTDDIGSDNYNLKLSLARAIAVKEALVAKGIDPSRISAKGRGEADPVATNSTDDGRALNRRIEAELIKN